MRSAKFEEGLSSYLPRLKHTQLTREQEYDLARRAKKGEAAARETLARSNLAFVVSTARKFANRGARLDDLIQEGNIGLMKAIEHFDPKKNVRFATYAVWWIRAYVTRYLKDNRSQVRGGQGERVSMTDFSLDATMDEESDMTFLERIQDPGVGPQEAYLAQEKDEEVRVALTRVKKRIGELGWDILQERLTQDKPRTLEELGARWGVSRERVRQVELRTKDFLARYLASLDPAQQSEHLEEEDAETSLSAA